MRKYLLALIGGFKDIINLNLNEVQNIFDEGTSWMLYLSFLGDEFFHQRRARGFSQNSVQSKSL